MSITSLGSYAASASGKNSLIEWAHTRTVRHKELPLYAAIDGVCN